MKTAKWITKKIGKILLWITGGIVGFILLILILLTIPSVQTYLAQKATHYLSQQMKTTVSIDKLRIDFRLNICFENLRLCDQYGNNLITAQKGRAGFPLLHLTKEQLNILIRPIVLDNADVTLRRYAGDTVLNIQFFVDFVKPRKERERKIVVDLQQLQLIDSRFQCRMDDTWTEDEPGVWNYRDIRLSDINLKLEQLLIVGDSLTFQIDQLSAQEHSGFQIDDLTGQLIIYRKGLYCLNTRIQTENKTDLSLDFRFEYTDFKDFGDFINQVSFNSVVHGGNFNLKDLGYFAGKLQGMETMVDIKTTVSGPISNFKIKHTHLLLGQKTAFDGDVSLTGLPNIEETFIDLSIKDLKADIEDIEAFILPMQQKIPIPALVHNLQWVKLQGRFIGLYNNFFSDMQLSTALGNGSCELMLNARANPISYDGKLEIQDLKLGELLQYDDLGLVSAKTQIKGKGLAIKDMDLSIDAIVSTIEYKNHAVENMLLTGNLLSKQFDGLIKCEDKDFDLDFIGNIDFNQEKPIYKFDLDVRAINLSSFQLLRPDSNVVVSAKIKTDLLGNSIDSMQGSLVVENFVYTENANRYTLPKLNLHIDQFGGINQHIQLNSDVLDMDIKGEFTYKSALSELQKRINSQLSNLVPYPAFSKDDVPQKMDMSLQMKKNIPLLVHFFPIVTAPKGILAKLSLNDKENSLSLQLETPQLTVKDQLISNIKVNVHQQSHVFDVKANCDAYRVNKTDSLADVQSFKLQSSINNNVIDFTANAKGNEKNKAEDIQLEGSVGFDAKNKLWIALKKGAIVWDTNTFVFDTSNYVYITPNNIYVENLGLSSRDKQKSINIKSHTANVDENSLLFRFHKIELGIFNMFLNPFQISLEGSATGNGKLIRTPEGWGIGSKFQVEELVFNDVLMGFLEANTVWQSLEKKWHIGANLYENTDKSNDLLLKANGFFDLANKYIDIRGDINSFNIKILEKYLQSFASKVEGLGTGYLTFSGKTSAPKLAGNLLLKNAVLGVAPLNTEYKIDEGKLRFVDTGFIFENVPVRDSYQGKGFVNGIITHKRLRDWGVDLRIEAENMLGLNTTAKENNLFYGKAFATGNVTIKGEANNLITINVDAVSNQQTDMTLSLDWATTAVESNFITFVTPDKEKTTVSTVNTIVPRSNLALNLKLNVTPDATVRVLLDPSIGGTIVGRGGGILEMSLDENDKFSVLGQYTLTEGKFRLAYADIFMRTFELENGSTITWNGDPLGGIMQVRALQTMKISTDFIPDNSTLPSSISINNIIKLSGNILNPDFSFTFLLPDADENTRSRVYNTIDTTDQEEMIRQMIFVLFLGRLEPSGNIATGTSTINNSLSYSISELVSHQINRVLSEIIPSINVSPVFHPGTDGTNREYIFNIRGSFLNGKLTFRSSLGYIENNENNADNQFLGDFLGEYSVSNSLKIRGFNITNQQNLLLYNNARYSQGIGLSYSKDFDRFKDLFVRKKKKKTKD